MNKFWSSKTKPRCKKHSDWLFKAPRLFFTNQSTLFQSSIAMIVLNLFMTLALLLSGQNATASKWSIFQFLLYFEHVNDWKFVQDLALASDAVRHCHGSKNLTKKNYKTIVNILSSCNGGCGGTYIGVSVTRWLVCLFNIRPLTTIKV